MNAKLITPTLLNQYNWLQKAPKGYWKEKAIQDFYNILHRIYPKEPSPEILLGRKFEGYIMKSAQSGKKGTPLFNEIRDLFIGAEFQKKIKVYLKIDEELYVVCGRVDAVFKNKILDLKTTSNFKGPENYLNGWQHLIYCLSEKIEEFNYIIVELKDNVIQDYHVINYKVPSWELVENKIKEKIKEIIEYINKDEILLEGYLKTFNRYL